MDTFYSHRCKSNNCHTTGWVFDKRSSRVRLHKQVRKIYPRAPRNPWIKYVYCSTWTAPKLKSVGKLYSVFVYFSMIASYLLKTALLMSSKASPPLKCSSVPSSKKGLINYHTITLGIRWPLAFMFIDLNSTIPACSLHLKKKRIHVDFSVFSTDCFYYPPIHVIMATFCQNYLIWSLQHEMFCPMLIQSSCVKE